MSAKVIGGVVNNTAAAGKGAHGLSGIPAGSRKMVQDLKEIVNCPEAEIYATLKECNMDPNEAVNRLLSQDPFREVKSKREKKKETKDTMDPRSRGANNSSYATNRGGRGGSDRYGRAVSSQFSSNESGSLLGKPTYKKENGAHAHAYTSASSSAPGMGGSNYNRRPQMLSDSVPTENKMPAAGANDVVPSSQPSTGFQSAWVGVPGQVSMADIVKKGRPQPKAPTMLPNHTASHGYASGPPSAVSRHDLPFSDNHTSKVSEVNPNPEMMTGQHTQTADEWPSIEKPSVVSSISEASVNAELYAEPANLSSERGNQHLNSPLDDAPSVADGETVNGNHPGPASISSRNTQEDGSGGSSLFDNNLYGNMSSYESHRHHFENIEAEDGASSAAANFQQLSIQDDDQGTPSEEETPSVIIPNHLQVQAQDCSHLSFGSFGSGIGSASAFPGPFASRPLEEPSEVLDASSAAHSDTRSPEYYGDEHLINTTDENLVHRAVSGENYDSQAVPQPDLLKEETPEVVQGNQYAFPSSTPGYNYENAQQLHEAFNSQQTSSQMQNVAPFSSVMQAYTNSLPSTLLASTQTGREPDLPYSPFPVAQSMSTKYSNTTSSISGPNMSMPEALRASGMTAQQPTQQTHPGASVASGPGVPQHLLHPYSQPTLPLGHFANMISYPFLAQSYTYMPSAFQQTFAGNNTYPQSLAAVLPQYKNSASVSSLPQSAAVASGYGYGSSTNIPTGNFPLNPPTAPTGTTIGYEDVLSSQYKDASHLMSLQQQSENSGMWVHGPGSRTMSAVPASTYYSFQGQNQQPPGFRQGQQPSQHFGGLGYPNYYHSQSGMSLEQQQQQLQQLQNSREGTLGGSQGQQPSKQQTQQQLWQNSY